MPEFVSIMKFDYTDFSVIRYKTLKSSLPITKFTELLTMSLLVVTLIFCVYPIFTDSLRSNAYAQENYGLKTFETRDLVIDLGNGLTTDAQLTLPLIGKGPFPGVLLIHGSGVADKDYYVNKEISLFKQISQYLSERGFAVLKYDKRGVGPNFTVANANVWGNLTFNDLKSDAQKALDVLAKQPEVDPNRISVIGHSEGTTITPRIAIDNPSKVKNIVLMGAAANNTRDLVYFRDVAIPLLYTDRVLDPNKTGV
ncbi:MAG: alpha/beta hydrolase family protein, partial [Candidatus Nitrosocosmicus sp.]